MKKDKMSERLTELQMFDLAKVYKKHDCLWNVSNKDYRSRAVRENAYQEMTKKVNIPGLTVKDLKQKIKNLRTSYYTELRKMEASVKEGGKYKPKMVWFPIVDEILKNVSRSQTINVETESEPESKETKTKQDDTQKTIVTLDEIADIVNPQTIYRQTNEPQTKYEDDEYENYGKYIALILRSMPTDMSIITKMKLQKTLADIQLLALRQKSLVAKPDEGGPSTSRTEEDPHKDPLGNLTATMVTDLSNVKREEIEED